MRSGPWKYREINNKAQLFNLNKDIGERNNVFSENPLIVKKMKKSKYIFERFFANIFPHAKI